MKKIFILILTFSLLTVTLNCKKQQSNESKNQTIYDLNPNSINLDKPIPVAKLKEAFLAWKNVKTITITGYPNLFFDNDSIGKRVELIAAPGSQKKLVECNLKIENSDKFSKQTTITIKGTIDRDYFGKIILKDCELVGKNEQADRENYIFPSQVKADKKYFVEDFFNSFYAWHNKVVTVIGNYWGTTTSTTSYGKTIRIDLTDPKTGEKAVGCNMKSEPPASLATNRDGVIVRGKIKEEVFGNVSMEECEVINR